MEDQADKEADALLPCYTPNVCGLILEGAEYRCENCLNRPAVAAALWKRDEEIERLNGLAGLYLVDLSILRHESAQLKAQAAQNLKANKEDLEMAEQHIIRITTNDTKKTYEFIDGQSVEGTPELYRLEVKILSGNGNGNFYANPYTAVSLHVEHETLVKAGHFKPADKSKLVEVTETLEDLVLRLLNMVGVRPQE